MQLMANQRAVTVVQPCQALAAARVHQAVIAPTADRSVMPRRADSSGPTQFVQTLVVDAEMVGDLVHHGDLDLLDNLLVVLAHL